MERDLPFDETEANKDDVLNYIYSEVRALTRDGRTITALNVRDFYAVIRNKFCKNVAYAVIATRVFFMLSDSARDEFSKRFYRRAASEVAAQAEVTLQIPGLRHRILAKTAAPGADHQTVTAFTELDPAKCKELLDIAFTSSSDPSDAGAVKIAKCGEFHEPLLQAAFATGEHENRLAACSSLASAAAALVDTNDTREKLLADAARREQAILKASDVCAKLPVGASKSEFTKQRMQVLVDTYDEPAVAAGILEWAGYSLRAPNAAALKFVIPKITALVHIICEHHQRKLLRKTALNVLHRAFVHRFTGTQYVDAVQECQTLLVDALATTTRCGMAPDLAKLIQAYYLDDHSIDNSHIRNLVIGILQRVEPPYSHRFLEFFIPVLNHQRVVAVLGDRGTALRQKFLNDA